MKWVTSTKINQWADNREAQALLPELIIRLIRATSSDIRYVRFPHGDAIHLAGWDGIVESNASLFIIPEGKSLWECGTNKNPKRKADEDYNKRTGGTSIEELKASIFVFVTPRVWKDSENWRREKKQSGYWKDVIVITAVELEDWLSLCPSVALWLAEKVLGHSLAKAYDFESYWYRWATGEKVSLKPDLLLGGREKEQQALYDVIATPSVSFIQSLSINESVAFAVAAILESPNVNELLPKCLVVEEETLLSQLIAEYSNLIFVTNVVNRNYSYAIQNSHCVIYAICPSETIVNKERPNLISLPLLDRDKFINSLVNSGVKKKEAGQLSRETVRNVTILRRRLGIDYSCPEWANPENIRELLPALLVSKWSDTVAGDHEIIALFSGKPYYTYIQKLQKWANSDDSPIYCIDGKWGVYSPYEVFQYAVRNITPYDYDVFKEAIKLITEDNDPDAIDKMNTIDFRWWSFKQKYSSRLKEGLFQTAVMISLSGNKDNNCLSTLPSIWVDNIMAEILNKSTIEWWLSNKNLLPLIAEVSPKSYIEFLRKDINKEDSIIGLLLNAKNNQSIWGSKENYSHFLFSLKTLLWSEECLLPVCCIVAECCDIVNDSETYDDILDTLYKTFVVWVPQTFADTDTRLKVLNTLSVKYPKHSFILLYKLLNRFDHSSVIVSSQPMRWRSFLHAKPDLTNLDVIRSINTICQLLISICDKSEAQACNILDLAGQVAIGKENQDLLFKCVADDKNSFYGSYDVANIVRHTIYSHKTYSSANWAMPSEQLIKWRPLLADIEPNELLEKYRWVFKSGYVEIEGIDEHEYCYEEINRLRNNYYNKIVKEIESVYGFNGVCEFAKKVDCPDAVGAAYAHNAKEEDYSLFLDLLLQDGSSSIIDFAKGFFRFYSFRIGVERVISIFSSIDINKYCSILFIPLSAPVCFCRIVWYFLDTLPAPIKDYYWKSITICYGYSIEDAVFLLRKMIENKRYKDAISIIHYCIKNVSIPTDLIEESIVEFLLSKNQGDIIRYELADIVYCLDSREDANKNKLCQIELLLFDLLGNYGDNNEIVLVKELLSNPNSMMEVIDKAYLLSSNNDSKKNKESISETDSHLFHSCYKLLIDIRKVPYVSKDFSINVAGLNNYIDKLFELGTTMKNNSCVNSTIGALLANYPEIEDYPPVPICDIIERYNNHEINTGFMIGIMNKRGVTIRSPFNGGTLELEESKKYKRYADRVRYSYPIVSKLFDTICDDYLSMSRREDIDAQLLRMEY